MLPADSALLSVQGAAVTDRTEAVKAYLLDLQDRICAGLEGADGGARFRPGAWPTESRLFDPESSVTIFEEHPPFTNNTGAAEFVPLFHERAKAAKLAKLNSCSSSTKAAPVKPSCLLTTLAHARPVFNA